LRIVEHSTSIAAAASGKILADLGAEVIKVEPPRTGDPARYHGPFPNDLPDPERSGLFLYLNTNKRGINSILRCQRQGAAAPPVSRGGCLLAQLVAGPD
jgi:crotonobetainyl-CoA:carnitine CoA-transferase CaiB-like acyl-CoA transferase